MDTIARLRALTAEREMSFYRLARLSGIPYSTLRNAAARGSQLSVESIERICETLCIPLYVFFLTEEEQKTLPPGPPG